MADPEKPILLALKGQTVNPVPIWLMRQAGRYLPEYRKIRAKGGSFLDLCFSPDLAIEVTLQPIRRFGFDAAILFSDILVVPHALGQKVDFREGEGPVLEALAGAGDLDRLTMAGFHGALAPVYATVKRLKASLPKETALIGFAGAPWTLASYMIEGRSSRDFAKIKAWAYGDPQSFARLIALLTEAVAQYLIAQIEAGAEILQIFDSWAGALSHPQMREWSLNPILAILERLRMAHPHIPVILFPRGIGAGYLDFARQGPGIVRALGLDSGVPLDWAWTQIQGGIALQGNLDPALLVAGGKPMREAALEILEKFGRGPFVFNLGHGILPQTPPDHVADLVRIVRAWRP